VKYALKLPKSYPEPGILFNFRIRKVIRKNGKMFLIGTYGEKKLVVVHSLKLFALLRYKKNIEFTGQIKDGFCFFPKIGPISPPKIDLDGVPEMLREYFFKIFRGNRNPQEAIRAWDQLLHYEIAVMQQLVKFSQFPKLPQKPLELNNLPFELSEEQKVAWKAIKNDLTSSQTTNRLVYGEVGSGKSLLIFLAAEHSFFNHRRVVILAPNCLLAEQLFQKIQKWNPKIKLLMLTGGVATEIPSGPIVLVGTHALFFRDIGKIDLLIIDEQQKFGVNQRQKLRSQACDLLMTTATPIPRTLGMILQGNISVSYLRKTWGKRETVVLSYNSYDKLLKRIIECAGKKLILWVVNRVQKAKDFAKKMEKFAGVILVHGKMENKREIFSKINEMRVGLVVATTVVEVGIDCGFDLVVIEDAQDFGLSQLHQIRGRVARKKGSIGYCVLLGDNLEKLQKIKEAEDGFKISRLDFENRGGSNLLSSKQHGMNCYFAKKLVNRTLENRPVTLEDIMAAKKLSLFPKIIDFFTEFTSCNY
jgi:RecG-like helicase